MTIDEFKVFWKNVHEVFGLNPQTPTKVAASAQTFVRVEHVPLEVLKFAQKRLEDRDELPKNMAKFIRDCWDEWRVSPGNGEGNGHALNLPQLTEQQRQHGKFMCQKILKEICHRTKRVPTQ